MSKSPPVPPANRSPKGTGDAKTGAAKKGAPLQAAPPYPENFDEQGQTGNIKQNTTNQGYQQDR